MYFYNNNYVEILEILTKLKHDPYAVERGLTELQRLIYCKKELREEMVIHGNIIQKVVEIVMPYSNHEVILTYTCTLFQSLISHQDPSATDIQNRIAEAGTMKLMFDTMKSDVKCNRLCQEACSLISLLCYDSPLQPHEENQLEISRCGALELIHDIFNRNHEDRALFLASMNAVADLCYENESNSEKALRCDIIQMCSLALHSRYKDCQVVISVTRALFFITKSHARAKRNLLLCSIFERLQSALSYHWENINAVYHCLRVIEIGIRNNETSKEVLLSCGAVLTITKIMHQMYDKHKVRVGGIFTVCFIIFNSIAVNSEGIPNPERIVQLMKAYVHQVTVQALASFSKTAHVLEQIVRLVETLGSVDANKSVLQRIGCTRHIKYIYNVIDHHGLQLLCERAISSLEGT